ncbi:MAG: hypothetical protein NTV93_03055 [Verrucomicrobia bacterium]|nr:hypothetical protein [Verrucomicrobiota bacterium]
METQKCRALIADDGPPNRQGWPIALVILAAGILRGSLLFGTALMPGMNGAYYLVQARAVLTHGTLGLPDLPLIFYLQASLARALQWISRRDLEPCILFAVKLTDAILPALVALPVALLVRRWTKAAGAPAWIAPTAAAAVTLSSPILGMVGNFEKNSLALLWLCLLLLFIHLWLTRPTFPSAVGVLCFWGLAALTHIGVFGATVLFSGLAIALFLALQRGPEWRKIWPLLAAALAVGSIAAGIVMWKFDAARIQRLAEALIHPADYLAGSKMGPGRPGGSHSPFFILLQAGPSLVFAVASIAALLTCWRRRAVLPPADLCVAGACAVGVLVMTGPWVQGDKAPRFFLIAIAPAVMAAAFALIHFNHRRLRAGLAILGAACMIAPSIFVICDGGKPVVSEDGLSELRSLAPMIANPNKTLIVARHGMEWWTAWALHTHISQVPALRSADWQNFEAIYFLRSKIDNRPVPGRGPGGFSMPGMFGGPPPPGGRPPGGPAHNANPMEDPEIPRDAETVHDGDQFIFSRVSAPPGFVAGQP